MVVNSTPESLDSEYALAMAGTQVGSQKWVSC